MIPTVQLAVVLREKAVVSDIGVSGFRDFESNGQFSDKTSQAILKFFGCPITASVLVMPKNRSIDVSVNRLACQRGNSFRRALQKLQIALTAIERRVFQGQQGDIARTENRSIFRIFAKWLERLRATQIIKELAVVDDAEMNFGVIGQHAVNGWHDRLPIVLAILSPKEDGNFIARLSVSPSRQRRNLIGKHEHVRVVLTNDLGDRLGRTLDSVDSLERHRVDADSARLVVDLGDRQPIINKDGLDSEPVILRNSLPLGAVSLLNQNTTIRLNVKVDVLIKPRRSRALDPRNRLKHRKRLANPRPGAALFRGDGVDVKLANPIDGRIDRFDGSHHVLVSPPFLDTLKEAPLLKESLVSLVANISSSNLKPLQPRGIEHLANRIEREEPQVCPVEQARVGVIPFAIEQVADHGPVLHVRDAGKDLSARLNAFDYPFEDAPRVMQVFEHVAKDEAIVIVQWIDPKHVLLNITANNMNTFAGGDFGGIPVTFNGNPLHPRIHPPISLAQRALATPDLEHNLGIGWNQRQQIMIHVPVVSHNRSPERVAA